MPVSTIDGTIEQVVPAKRHPKVSRYKSLVFRRDDGTTQTIQNAIARGDVANEIREGNRARFYAFSTFDVKGVHGVRRPDGTALFAYPGTVNTAVFLMLLIANMAWIALGVFAGDGVPLLGVALGGFGAIALFLIRQGASSARAQFDADSAAAPG
jgi:hypothetical protein